MQVDRECGFFVWFDVKIASMKEKQDLVRTIDLLHNWIHMLETENFRLRECIRGGIGDVAYSVASWEGCSGGLVDEDPPSICTCMGCTAKDPEYVITTALVQRMTSNDRAYLIHPMCPSVVSSLLADGALLWLAGFTNSTVRSPPLVLPANHLTSF
ncbi:hypothetical protein LINPERHAP1_LOCUS22652 [Linum perenne]